MKQTCSFIAFALFLSSAGTALAQKPTFAELEARRAAEEAEYKRQQEERKKLEEHREKMEKGVKVSERLERKPVALMLESQLPSREKRLLSPSPDVQQQFSQFLRGPDTGLFKLLPPVGRTVSASGPQAYNAVIPIRGGGAFYSFTKRRHDADEWAQLRLLNGQLQSGSIPQERVVPFGSDVTTVRFTPDGVAVLVPLGDVSLEAVGVETAGVAFLNQLMPPTDYQALAGFTQRLAGGIRVGSFTYASALPVKPETTFVLRSVLYKQADILVAFRVVRLDADGSVHILWKQLQSYPPLSLKGKPPKKN